MADTLDNIRVIKLFKDSIGGLSQIVDCSIFRAVGNMSIQYDITGSKMDISYVCSVNGVDFIAPANAEIVKNAKGSDIVPLEAVVAPLLKIFVSGDGTSKINLWIAVQ